jgi:hypothetical protein
MRTVVNPALMMVVHLDSDSVASNEPSVSSIVDEPESHSGSERQPRLAGPVKPD